MLKLTITKRTDPRLLELMKRHYSQPKGFVGRSICYAVEYNDVYYGHIVAGSATLHLAGRNEFFSKAGAKNLDLKQVANNIFFHIEKQNNKYPVRCFAEKCLRAFEARVFYDWLIKYGDVLIGLESLVELPRTGDCYMAANWTKVGQTKGFTCKREAGQGTDSWTGKRVWNTNKDELRPKWVFCKMIEHHLGH